MPAPILVVHFAVFILPMVLFPEVVGVVWSIPPSSDRDVIGWALACPRLPRAKEDRRLTVPGERWPERLGASVSPAASA